MTLYHFRCFCFLNKSVFIFITIHECGVVMSSVAFVCLSVCLSVVFQLSNDLT